MMISGMSRAVSSVAGVMLAGLAGLAGLHAAQPGCLTEAHVNSGAGRRPALSFPSPHLSAHQFKLK